MNAALIAAREDVEDERWLYNHMSNGNWSAEAIENQRRNLMAAIDREFKLS